MIVAIEWHEGFGEVEFLRAEGYPREVGRYADSVNAIALGDILDEYLMTSTRPWSETETIADRPPFAYVDEMPETAEEWQLWDRAEWEPTTYIVCRMATPAEVARLRAEAAAQRDMRETSRHWRRSFPPEVGNPKTLNDRLHDLAAWRARVGREAARGTGSKDL